MAAGDADPLDLAGGPGVRQLNLHEAATRIAVEQAWLHWFMLITCFVIFVLVFSVMFYSIWKHRKSVGHKSANFHESTVVEIAWTIVPFIIVIAMALPATKVLVAQRAASPHEQDMTPNQYADSVVDRVWSGRWRRIAAVRSRRSGTPYSITPSV